MVEKHTRKNAFCADEVDAAMGCGSYGGLQRWQLTITCLAVKRKKVVSNDLKALHCAGLFVYMEIQMDIIYECAAKFVALENYEYHFVVSQKRKTKELFLNFCDSDFFHLAGFHYLKDISIPQNRQKTIKDILDKKIITDKLLCKSQFYMNPRQDKDIKSRVEELRFLEEYLDTNNLIRIYNTRNDKYLHSMIKSDYVIESKFKNSDTSVYIFLQTRQEDPSHLSVISFFKKGTVSYGGDKLYWMLKEKMSSSQSITLYRHPNCK